jgi:hypothetical protein
MNHDELKAALAEMRRTQNAADSVANTAAELLVGRLQYVSDYNLGQLKKQLRAYNPHTRRWKK